jgi:tetratricopeptide (TPR) repeat protein
MRAALAGLALMALALPVAAAQGPDPLRDARTALDRKDGVSAEVDLRRALKAGVPQAKVAAMMGEAKTLQGDFAGADQWLDPEQFAPDQREYGYHMLGRLKMEEGKFDAADKAFSQALEAGQGSAGLWVDIGRLRYRTGAQDKAVDASLMALERDPKNPRALEFRGQLVRDSQGFAAALPWFSRGLKIAPNNLSLLGEYAATLGELGRAKDMLRITRKMIKLDGHNARAFYLQAVLAARVGNDNLARRLMWRVGDSFQNVPSAILLTGILDLRAGNNALAVEDFDDLVRMQPDNPLAQELFGRALLENGDAREVVQRFAKLAQRGDASPYLLTVVGRAYEVLGDRAAAAPYLDRAALPPRMQVWPLANNKEGELALFRYGDDPFRLDAAVPRVRDQLAAGDITGALAVTTKLGERYTGSVDYQTLAGDVALAAGDPGGALEHYRAAAKVRRSLLLIERMVAALQQLGKGDEADALARNFLAEHPLDRDAAELVGTLAVQRGDWRRVRVIYSWLLSTAPGVIDPHSHLMLALTEAKTGAPKQALANATAAYRMQPANGRATWLLGKLLQQAGGHEKAASALLAKAEAMGVGVDEALAER